MQNPSKGMTSTSRRPQSSSPQRSPPPTTPESLDDLTISDNSGGSSPPPAPKGQSGCGSLGMGGDSVAIGGGGGDVVLGDTGPRGAVRGIGASKNMVSSDAKDHPAGKQTCNDCKKTFPNEHSLHGHMQVHSKLRNRSRGAGRGAAKRRKTSDVEGPSTGTPSCKVCNKEFPTWRGVCGHMKFHGGANGSPGEAGSSGGQGTSGESGPLSPVREFDPNQPMEVAANPAEERNVNDENKFRFDLNEPPPSEDEEEEKKLGDIK